MLPSSMPEKINFDGFLTYLMTGLSISLKELLKNIGFLI